jgi:hypothetical protein
MDAFWVESVGYVLFWEFEHYKKGRNLFRSLPWWLNTAIY